MCSISRTKFFKFQAYDKKGTLLSDSFEDNYNKYSSIRKVRAAATAFKKSFNAQFTDTKVKEFTYFEVKDHRLGLGY